MVNTYYSGCSTITTNDFQAAVWALLHQTGECDNFYGGGIWLNNLVPSEICFFEGSSRDEVSATVDQLPAAGDLALVFVPQFWWGAGQSLIVAVDVNSWGVSRQCNCPTMAPTTTPLKATTTVVAPPPTTTKPVATCISSFKQSYPSTCVGHSLSTGPPPWSFVYATIGFVSGTFTNQRSWCVNYNHDAFSEQSYSQSTVYTYDHVVASPQFAPDIDQPDRLNQD